LACELGSAGPRLAPLAFLKEAAYSTAHGKASASVQPESAMSNPSVNKRQKEKSRHKQREKDVKRKQRRDDRANRAPGESSLDTAIAHIVPGPQPPTDES